MEQKIQTDGKDIQSADANEELRKENQSLKEKIREYEALEEELMAQRVFKNAKKQLWNWITLGGIITTLVGLIGITQLYQYTKGLVSTEVDGLSRDQIRLFAQSKQNEVASFADSLKNVISSEAQQDRAALANVNAPIGFPANTELGLPDANTSPIDYSSQLPPVRDQGDEGSCVAFAAAGALEFQIHKTLGRNLTLSPRYLYYYASGGSHSDNGAAISAVISVLTKRGAVAETAWPYIAGDLKGDPPPAAENGEHFRVKKAILLSSLDQIKAAIQKNGPILCGVDLYQSWSSPQTAKTGLIPLPKPGEDILGGYALCLVGYDDQKKLFKVRTSWGPKWGESGYGYLSYAYAKRFVRDAWAISI